MSTLALFAFLCGAVLAFRYRVLVLYPIIAFGALFTLVLGMTAGRSFSSLMLGIVACAVALQIGYLFGGVMRTSMVAARAARRRELAHAKAAVQRFD
ncbi:MAG TPA: hypothetical protein VM867_12980 [Xanthobacteraceae bacterium]|nr:hypothetical protein [Xanthobacteraceae bacterium]